MKKTAIVAALILVLSINLTAQEKDIFSIIKMGTVKQLKAHLAKNPESINDRDSNQDVPLAVAVSMKNNMMAKVLANHGAKPTQRTGKYNNHCILVALRKGNHEIVKWFVQKGFDVNHSFSFPGRGKETFSTPFFHHIVGRRDADLIKFIIDRGVDVNAKSSYGSFYLDGMHMPYYMKEDNRIEIMEILFRAGADINHQDRKSKSLLMNMISFPTKTMESSRRTKITEITKFLINKGIDLNLQDEEGWTALHCAVWFNNIEVLRLLLEAGADPDIEQRKGEKPIDFAKRLKRQEMVKLLKGANKS